MKGCVTGSVLGVSFLSSMLHSNAQEDVSLIQKEIERRSGNVAKAQDLLSEGDSAYKKADFKKAVAAYREAFELIPEAGLTHELRFAAGDRYAQAVVEYSKVLARTGQYDIARKNLDDVLKEDVAPGNVGAMMMQAKLDDPVRYSPTLTPEHVRNIEKVAHKLRKAESYFLQAQYDQALISYEEVLLIDPYNKAARRGMERVAVDVSAYAETARDQARGKALSDIDAQWELKVPPANAFPGVVQGVEGSSVDQQWQDVRGSKLKQIIVPTVELDDVSFADAIRAVRVWARELDVTELDPDKRGMNIVNRLGDDKAGFKKKIEQSRVNLSLKNVPLSVVLDYITQQTGTYWRQEQFAVVVRPRGTSSTELETRVFRVPAGFLNDLTEKKEVEDVFGDAPTLQARTGVLEGLKNLGISFPEGATAFFNRSNNTLRVRNTPFELDAIEGFVRSQALGESVMVVMKTSVLEVSEDVLEELGYDWLIDPSQLNNNNFLGGGTQGNGGLITPVPGVVNGTTVTGGPVTSGLRSGDGIFLSDSIDDRIAGITTDTTNRSASPLSLTGQINDTVFQTILRAINQKTSLSSLNQSTTVSVAGQRVELMSGDEFIYPTEFEPGELPNTTNSSIPILTPANPTAFETRQLGFDISVEPTVSEDKNYIDLQVNPTITNFDGFIEYGSPINTLVTDPITGLLASVPLQTNSIIMPVFRTVRVNTAVTIQDGATIVVGGLVQNEITNVNDKVPVLGDLPLIGRFFQSEGVQNRKTAVVIFIKVELVDPTGEAWRNR